MRRFKLLYVYILKCSDGTYYTGVSNDPDKRELQHNLGINKEAYTYSRRPVKIVYAEGFMDYLSAIDWETRIKKWNKKKKEALINEKREELQKAAECKNKTTHKRMPASHRSPVPVSARSNANQDVRSGANQDVRSSANQDVRSSANQDVRSSANQDVRSSAVETRGTEYLRAPNASRLRSK